MPYAGTMGTVRAAVIDRLKMDATLDTTRVLEWINLAYAQVVQDTGCLQTCGTSLLVENEGGYTFPDAVMWVKAMQIVYPDDTFSVPMEKVTLDRVLELRRQLVTAGERVNQPVYAILGQNRFEVWPTPVDGTSVKFWYVYLPEALTDPSDTFLIREPFGSKLLELGACVEGAKFKKDPLLQAYMNEFDQWMRRFQGWLNKRQTGQGQTMEMVVGEDRQPTLTLLRDVG